MSGQDEQFIDLTVFDGHGNSIGTVTDVIVDPENLDPQYLAVRTGRFSLLSGEHLVPVQVVHRRGNQLVVPFDRDTVKKAPITRDHIAPSSDEQERIAIHYGV